MPKAAPFSLSPGPTQSRANSCSSRPELALRLFCLMLLLSVLRDWVVRLEEVLERDDPIAQVDDQEVLVGGGLFPPVPILAEHSHLKLTGVAGLLGGLSRNGSLRGRCLVAGPSQELDLRKGQLRRASHCSRETCLTCRTCPNGATCQNLAQRPSAQGFRVLGNQAGNSDAQGQIKL